MFYYFLRFRITVIVVVLALRASSLHAQVSTNPPIAPEPETPAKATPPSPSNPLRLSSSWEDGLVFQSDDQNYRIQLGSMLRLDGRYIPNDPSHLNTDTFTVRVARINFQGRIAKYFTFRVVPELVGAGGGIPTVVDAWFDIELSKALHVRFGRDKAQVGYEVLLSDANTLFVERGLTVNLHPIRDVGIQVYGDLPGGIVSYATGVFNGVVDGTNSTNVDTDTSKDLVGRVVVTPFARVQD